MQVAELSVPCLQKAGAGGSYASVACKGLSLSDPHDLPLSYGKCRRLSYPCPACNGLGLVGLMQALNSNPRHGLTLTGRLIDWFVRPCLTAHLPCLSHSPPAFMADTRMGRGIAIHIVTVKVIIFGTNEPVWHCRGVSALYIRAVPFSVS